MSIKLKNISDQVIVITGASSGIGLATAVSAAKQKAKVVLVARSQQTLESVAHEINAVGGEAIAVPCDVADRRQVDRVIEEAIQRFGCIDTWVNNAGLGMYGRLDESVDEESRRLFDINFWGVVNGSLAMLPHLKKNGGALITIGSEVSEAYTPLLGIYTASKHAVKGLVDTLRVEIEEIEQAPVAITLIEPTAVDTPFPQHARNYMSREPKLPTPMIDPQQVADAIFDAAQSPTREKKVGMMSKVNTAAAKYMPSVADRYVSGMTDDLHYDELPRTPQGALYVSSEETEVAGQTHGTGGREEAD